MTQRTLAIIKPDAVAAGNAGRIIARIEAGGFTILAAKLIRMSHDDAAGFDVSYLPEELRGRRYYRPSGAGEELADGGEDR